MTEEVVTKVSDDVAEVTTPVTNEINVEEEQNAIDTINAAKATAIANHNMDIAQLDARIFEHQTRLDKAASVGVIPDGEAVATPGDEIIEGEAIVE